MAAASGADVAESSDQPPVNLFCTLSVKPAGAPNGHRREGFSWVAGHEYKNDAQASESFHALGLTRLRVVLVFPMRH